MKRFMSRVGRQFRYGEKGFTLIELLVVVAILGVLAAVVVPNLGTFFGRGKVEGANTEMANVQVAVSSHMAEAELDDFDGDVGPVTATGPEEYLLNQRMLQAYYEFLDGGLEKVYNTNDLGAKGAQITAGTPARVVARRDPLDTDSPREAQRDLRSVEHQWRATPSILSRPGAMNQRRPKGEQLPISIDVAQKVTQAIFGAIDEINEQRSRGQQLAKSIDTALYNGSGSGNLDSLALLNLIVATEQRIEENLGITVNLADERTMSLKDNPFKTIGTLSNCISSILEEKSNG